MSNPVADRIEALISGEPTLTQLGEMFAAAGFELALVGGPVRDALLGITGNDWDFATNATPEEIEQILKPWAEAIWDMGREFGTIGAQKNQASYEITTYRCDKYDPNSRKPEVDFGDTLSGDLSRRDFTVNSMAVRLDQLQFVDPFQGLSDLAAGVLRTPADPVQSFSDDPLRMMRGARFAAQLGFALEEQTYKTMQRLRDRLQIVSAERIRDEFSKLLLTSNPRAGLAILVDTGLADQFFPELSELRLEIDEHHRHKDVYEHSLTVLDQAMSMEHRIGGQPDLVTRLAALLHDIGKPRTRKFKTGGLVTFHHHDVVGAKLVRKRLRELRYPNNTIDSVSKLIELHLRFHGYGTGEWTDSAVRRYVRDAGDELERLHILTRADCTTRNQRKAKQLSDNYDHLEERIAKLSEAEELLSLRPDLDGNEIIQLLGIEPGPLVGEAYKFLLELRIDRGPMERDEAIAQLQKWFREQQHSSG